MAIETWSRGGWLISDVLALWADEVDRRIDTGR
jgi:hypothetical protein